MAEVLNPTQPQARKLHHCDYCGCTIIPGERYYRAAIVDAGDAWTWKSHLVCHHLAQVFWDRWACIDFGMTRDSWWDGLWRTSMAEIEEAFVGVFSPRHYRVQRLLAAWRAGALPTAWSTAKSGETRRRYRNRWHRFDRGELVVLRAEAPLG